MNEFDAFLVSALTIASGVGAAVGLIIAIII